PAAVLPLERSPLGQVTERLLEEEGVAAGAFRQEFGDRIRQLAVRAARGEGAARVERQRPELDLAVAVWVELARPLAEAPGAVLPLGPVQEEERDGGLLGHAQRLLEQLEGRLVRPVEILEDEAERPLVGEPAHELREDVEGLTLDALPVQLTDALGGVGLQRDPEEAREEWVDVVRVPAEEVRELGLEIEADAGLGRRRAHAQPFAQEVADRPVGQTLGVGDGAALDEADAVAVAVPDLDREPRLADAGLSDHRHDPASSLEEAFDGALEHRQLEVAADE